MVYYQCKEGDGRISKKLRTVLLNVNGEAKEIEIEANLDEYYKALNCSCIDIVSRTVNGVRFDIMCDDEGLLKDRYKISAINKNFEPMLVGNLMFFHHDGDGNEVGLSDEDVEWILASVGITVSMFGASPCVCGVEY